MSGHKEQPVKRTNGKVPGGCSKCKCAFNPEVWPRSDWTLTGWSPWCPQCHSDHSRDTGNFSYHAKPGPKPKPKLPEERPYRARGAARFQRSKTHCPQGHEYNEANTYHGKKGRTCRVCRRASVRKAKAKERGEMT